MSGYFFLLGYCFAREFCYADVSKGFPLWGFQHGDGERSWVGVWPVPELSRPG